jgi:DNA-binding NtrC family response regulator
MMRRKMDKKAEEGMDAVMPVGPVGSSYELFMTFEKGEIYDKVIARTEKVLIENALKTSFGNQSIAAKLLGINRNTLHTKIKKMSIEVSRFKI